MSCVLLLTSQILYPAWQVSPHACDTLLRQRQYHAFMRYLIKV